MRVLVSFDIACPRRRRRVVRLLLAHGERVQESVFELELREAAWRRLCTQLDAAIHPVQDQWRAWRACADDRADTADLGLPSRPVHEGACIV